MNKLIIALMATAFAGSVMAADAVKVVTKSEIIPAASVSVKTEKPAAAPKKARKHNAKKAAAKKAAAAKTEADAAMPAMPATPAMPAMPATPATKK